MKDIMYVLTAAECKSISRAAEILYISQPALSRYISKLERELGWKPKETFESGIRKTVMWYLANEQWVNNVKSGAYASWLSKQYGDNN